MTTAKGNLLLSGDCLEVLKTLKDNSVDAVVTDPPYGLGDEPDIVEVMRDWVDHGYHEVKSKKGFMNKTWDAFVPQPVVWREVFRVLKPGGHILVACGTRTQDWMTASLRFAGFEIRDVIAWLYGSGFPKSLNISKMIDKRGGQPHLTTDISQAIKEARLKRKMTLKECDDIFCSGTTNWSWFEGRPAGVRMPTTDTFLKICKEWPELQQFYDLVAEAEREKIGIHTAPAKSIYSQNSVLLSKDVPITAPATDAAKAWDGWGTALKPAMELWTLARKPLSENTVAANVLKWGTGGLNIDGCRVGEAIPKKPGGLHRGSGSTVGSFTGEHDISSEPEGRFPANLIHDGSDEVVGLFPDTKSTQNKESDNRLAIKAGNSLQLGKAGVRTPENTYTDSGSAARFFYCAKASKSERGEGNVHPTVKPLALMRYLCRLITPEWGTILDPFAGSGTTGAAAIAEDFGVILIEREAEYLPIIEKRLNDAENAA